ncbi:DUF935 domain-containing protein [[Clostridium] colinum]|uniref:DUF935 domain-containing protein n=1 Tax=[Clostridium] colinum TaxID=36835 RepID=UPI002023F0DC|nr:DUF935 domain-containing protein [[Clostridium] colinum]
MFNIFKKKTKELGRILSKIHMPTFLGTSSYPSSNLTPTKLTKIFREADAGYTTRQMELFEEMEEKDTHLFSQLQTRKNAVVGLDWEIIAFSEDEKDKQIAEFVKDVIKNIKDFDNSLLDLLDAIGKGISFLEINWVIDKGFLKVKELSYIHPKHIYWEEEKLKIITKDNLTGVYIGDIQENKFIIHKYKARSGHESRAGLLRVIAWMYLFKNYTLKDWITFIEKYGMPILLGEYDESSSEADKDALTDALINIGTDSAGIINKNTKVNVIDNEKRSSADIFERMARFCDEQISKAILGQTLTSDSGGSYAQSKTHNEVRRDLTSADCKALANTLKEYLIRPIVTLNFGEECNIPDFVFDFEEAEDLLKTVEVYSKLKNELGLNIDTEHLYEKFKIPKPENYIEDIKILKENTKNNQKEIDKIVEELKENGVSNFKSSLNIFKKEISKATTLDEVKEIFKDEKRLNKILKSMNDSFNKESLKGGLILSNLVGRYEDE